MSDRELEEITVEQLAGELADGLLTYHLSIMDDDEARNAVIIKSIALVALAYGIPPSHDEPFDIDETIEKLRYAMKIIQRKERVLS